MIENKFSPCQERALDLLINSSENVFLTGQAGTGKSFLVKQFLESNPYVPIVASTGRAALLVGGVTFHSFFRIIPFKSKAEIFAMTMQDRKYVNRMRDTYIIIIDEISMLSGETLALAEELARTAKGVDLPWGGMRIIAVGDFAQLPPVAKMDDDPDWAFTHPVWEKSNFKNAPLKTIMRTTDLEFIEVLNDLRAARKVKLPNGNKIATEKIKTFFDKKLISRQQSGNSEFVGTRVYARKNRVRGYNHAQLVKIPHPAVTIKTVYHGEDYGIAKFRDEKNEVPMELVLKQDALVMIKVNNMSAGYVNGTLAYVEKISDTILTLRHATTNEQIFLDKKVYEWKKGDGQTIATATQFPVILGWAITIHGSQGTTLDTIYTDLSDLWEFGQCYTAVSRLKTGNGLNIEAWNPESIIASKKVRNFYKEMGL